MCVSECLCVLYARNGSLYRKTEWPTHNYRHSSSLSINSSPLFSFPLVPRKTKKMRTWFRSLWSHVLMHSHLSSCCCLNMSLFFSPLLLTTTAEFDMQVLPPSFSLSHTQTILDGGGESASLSPCYNFLTALHYSCVCVWLRVCEKEMRERKG